MNSTALLCLFAAACSAATITLPEVTFSGVARVTTYSVAHGGGGSSIGKEIFVSLQGTNGFSFGALGSIGRPNLDGISPFSGGCCATLRHEDLFSPITIERGFNLTHQVS